MCSSAQAGVFTKFCTKKVRRVRSSQRGMFVGPLPCWWPDCCIPRCSRACCAADISLACTARGIHSLCPTGRQMSHENPASIPKCTHPTSRYFGWRRPWRGWKNRAPKCRLTADVSNIKRRKALSLFCHPDLLDVKKDKVPRRRNAAVLGRSAKRLKRLFHTKM